MPRAKARTPRPARPAPPPMPLLATLEQTHRNILHQLAQMTDLIDHLDTQGLDEHARGLAREACSFFNDTVQPHHAAEERTVFPALLASGDAELVQHVQRLQQDHGWLEEDWLEMAPHLQAIAQDQNWYDPDLLRAAIPVFTQLCYEHIALEESLVYPASLKLRG